MGGPSRGAGYSCDDSFAFSCARCLLHPASLDWLNGADVARLSFGSADFRSAWGRYSAWLQQLEPEDADDAVWPAAPEGGFA